jgi:hypothetical protein
MIVHLCAIGCHVVAIIYTFVMGCHVVAIIYTFVYVMDMCVQFVYNS